MTFSSSDLANFSRARKAAIVVQALMREGEVPPITDLPEALQITLTREIARLHLVDRETVDAVVSEFTEQLEALGLTAPRNLDASIASLSAHLSPTAAAQLRAEAAGQLSSDPWQQVRSMSSEELTKPLMCESIEICAVLLSRLPSDKAATAIAKLPGDRARRIALAFSRATQVNAVALQRIGHAIVRDYYSAEPAAFETAPEARVGAILNSAQANFRTDVLEGLDAADPPFADRVRRAIFTYANIPERLSDKDVPKAIRALPPETLSIALASTLIDDGPEGRATAYLLENLPQRLALSLREQALTRQTPKKSAGTAALISIASELRQMADRKEITFISSDDEEES